MLERISDSLFGGLPVVQQLDEAQRWLAQRLELWRLALSYEPYEYRLKPPFRSQFRALCEEREFSGVGHVDLVRCHDGP